MSISNKAKIISPKFIGKNVVVEDGVFIDEGCHIGHNVVIHKSIKATNLSIGIL
ncbi:MAG: hypothetical protein U9O59_00835 [Actinomycetota bacterium]|nr:hypothetical protein [Actinomycetota bacterium]